MTPKDVDKLTESVFSLRNRVNGLKGAMTPNQFASLNESLDKLSALVMQAQIQVPATDYSVSEEDFC